MSDRVYDLWIFRHGETPWTLTGQHTGRTDLPLTEDGRRAAVALGQRLAGRSFGLVLTSPLVRASETCRLAGYGDVARPCDDLMEWDYGAYDGVRRIDIRKEIPAWTIWKDGVRGGETIAQVAERARRAIALADAASGDVALFAHGHLLRILTACWLGLEPEAGRYFELGTTTIGVLGRSDGTPVLRRWNDT
jgi:probable phosphoglycerate mutase